MPVYENFIDQNVSFMLGNIREMMLVQVADSLPEVIVTSLVTIIGFLYVLFGIYFRIKSKSDMGIVSFGIFSLSFGLWKCFDFSFLSLLSETR